MHKNAITTTMKSPVWPQDLTFTHTQTPRNGGSRAPRLLHTYKLTDINYDTGTAVFRIVNTKPCGPDLGTNDRPNVLQIMTDVNGQVMHVVFTESPMNQPRSAPEVTMDVSTRPLGEHEHGVRMPARNTDQVTVAPHADDAESGHRRHAVPDAA